MRSYWRVMFRAALTGALVTLPPIATHWWRIIHFGRSDDAIADRISQINLREFATTQVILLTTRAKAAFRGEKFFWAPWFSDYENTPYFSKTAFTDAVMVEIPITIDYGVDLAAVSRNAIRIDGKSVYIRLPPPRSLGQPRVDSQSVRRIDTLTSRPETDKSNADLDTLEREVIAEAQGEAVRWAYQSGVDASVRETTRRSLRTIIQHFAGNDISVHLEFDDEGKAPGAQFQTSGADK